LQLPSDHLLIPFLGFYDNSAAKKNRWSKEQTNTFISPFHHFTISPFHHFTISPVNSAPQGSSMLLGHLRPFELASALDAPLLSMQPPEHLCWMFQLERKAALETQA